MFKLIIILIAAIAGLKQVEAACNTCNSYGVACIDENHFRICSGEVMDESTTVACESGEICTDLGLVCVPKGSSTAKAACESFCGVCEGSNTFTCTSRNTYALCKGGVISNVTSSCPTSKVCDTTGNAVCVSPCEVKQLKCDRDAVTTTSPSPSVTSTPSPSATPTPSPSATPTPSPSATPAPTPTPSPSPSTNTTIPAPTRTAAEVCAAKGTAGRYPYDDNDNRCTTLNYVYCRYNQNSTLNAIPSTCPTGSYFNKDEQSCGTSRPAGCVGTISA